MTAWLCDVQVILQEADFANNDHLQETIEAAQVQTEIYGYIFIKSIWTSNEKMPSTVISALV